MAVVVVVAHEMEDVNVARQKRALRPWKYCYVTGRLLADEALVDVVGCTVGARMTGMKPGCKQVVVEDELCEA
eukprot:625366-Amphidinium_carterae.3